MIIILVTIAICIILGVIAQNITNIIEFAIESIRKNKKLEITLVIEQGQRGKYIDFKKKHVFEEDANISENSEIAFEKGDFSDKMFFQSATEEIYLKSRA